MSCSGAPDNKQVVKDTETGASSSRLGIGDRSGEMDIPVCAKLTDLPKEQLQLHLKKRKLRFERFESD